MAHAIAQAPDGRVWIGTESGLARFDGRRFTTIDLAAHTGDRLQFVKALAIDPAGAVYVGTSASGLLLSNESRPAGLRRIGGASNPVEALVLADDGRAYVALDGSGVMVRAADETTFIVNAARGLSSPHVKALAPRRSGGVWVGMTNGTVQWLAEDGQVGPIDPSFANLPRVEALLEDDRGRLWIGTREGLFRSDAGKPRRVGRDVGLDQVFVTDLMQDSNGAVWIATSLGGVYRDCGGRLEAIPAAHGLAQLHVQSLFEDHEGGIWLATFSRGVIRLSRGAAWSITAQDGLPPHPILPVLQTTDGTIWIGTFGGGLVALGEQGQVTHRLDVGGGNVVLSLLEHPRGNLWVGTRGGLLRIRAGQVIERFTAADGLTSDTVISLLTDGEAVWIGAIGGLSVLRHGRIERIAPDSASQQGNVQMLFEDASGTLWIGTDGNGLLRLEDSRIERASFDDMLPSPVVLALGETPGIGLWIGTDAGLALWDDRSLRVFTPQHGMPRDAVFSILEDDAGALWLSGNQGVYRIDRAGLESLLRDPGEPIRVDRFGSSHGMPTSETNGGFDPAAWRDRSGRHWYPTSKGLAIFEPARLRTSDSDRRVVIDTLEADGRDLPVEGEIVLPPQPGRVRLGFVSPEFRHPDAIEYEYRLGGYETSFYSSNDGAAVFTRLPPGQFEFEVRARGPNEPWSAPARLAFRVKPLLWQRTDAWIVAALAVATVLWLVNAWWNGRRARAMLALQQRQKLESMGLLAGGLAHDFNNVLTVILGETELLGEKVRGQPELAAMTDHISRAAWQGAGLTRQLLTFARQGKGQKDWVDLGAATEDARKFIERLMPGSVRVTFDIEPGAGECLIDPSQFQQVLLNLAHNAREAMPDGGRLQVELGPVEDPRELPEANLDPGRSYARLVLRDSGVGMDEKTRRRLFEPLFTTRANGTGLGLAVVYGIVSEVGGTIEVSSAPGKGARFTVYLPVRRSAEAGAAATEASATDEPR